MFVSCGFLWEFPQIIRKNLCGPAQFGWRGEVAGKLTKRFRITKIIDWQVKSIVGVPTPCCSTKSFCSNAN